jgi:hypothetical protein
MPGLIRKPIVHRTSRKMSGGPTKPQPTAPIGITSVAKAASVLTIVFNQPVSLKGVPAYTTNLAGVTALSAVMTNSTTLALTFSAAVTTATTLNIPYEEPAVRNSSGGFVSNSTFPVT